MIDLFLWRNLEIERRKVYEAKQIPIDVGNDATIEFINNHQFIVKKGKIDKNKISYQSSDEVFVSPKKGFIINYSKDGGINHAYDEDGLEVGSYYIASKNNKKVSQTQFKLKNNEIISSKKVYQYFLNPINEIEDTNTDHYYPFYSETIGLENTLYGDAIIRKQGQKTIIYIKADATNNGEVYMEDTLLWKNYQFYY